ncbi:MAG: ATP-binding protein [Solirubrobacteraceae bacterium]
MAQTEPAGPRQATPSVDRRERLSGVSPSQFAQLFCNNSVLMQDIVAHDASILLAFRAANVRSFRDEIELSMVATSMSEPRFVRQVAWREGGRPIGVVPVVGVFGPNASGKSNLLEAMDDMRALVLQSFRQEIKRGPNWFFRLDSEGAKRPSRYEVELILHGVRHEYGFVLDGERVIEEWAYRYPRGRPATLFSRTGDDVEAGSAGRGETRSVQKVLRSDSLFLSAAAATNHSLLVPLYDWFRRNMQLAHIGNRPRRQILTVEMLEDQVGRERLLAMLGAADLGIVDAKKLKPDPEAQEKVTRALRAFLGEVGVEDEVVETLDLDNFGFTLIHQGDGSLMELPPGLESQGTVVWLGLIGPVVSALTDGTVLLADELDASLHPALVEQLVRLFQDPEANPRRAQLIFNSHDPTILGDSSEDRLLGRDQIWFTEKLMGGNCRLYPLTELRPRKHEAIGRRYLDGRYGAMPILSRQAFDRIVSVPDE